MSWLRDLAGEGAEGQGLVLAAEAFLQGRGVVLLGAYALLDLEERAALALAGERLDVAQAARVGRAARSALGEAEVLAALDGGERAMRLQEDEVFAALGAALRGEGA